MAEVSGERIEEGEKKEEIWVTPYLFAALVQRENRGRFKRIRESERGRERERKKEREEAGRMLSSSFARYFIARRLVIWELIPMSLAINGIPSLDDKRFLTLLYSQGPRERQLGERGRITT